MFLSSDQMSNILFYILLVLYFIYLSVLMMSAFSELRSMPYFDVRLKLQTFLMIFVLTISLLTIVLSSSSSSMSAIPFLQLLPFSYYFGSSAAFLSLFSIINLYVCISAYYYRPSLNQHTGRSLLLCCSLNFILNFLSICGQTVE